MYKRIISIVCILSICVSFLVLPVNAMGFDDSVSDSGLMYTDYKTSSYYEWEYSNYSGSIAGSFRSTESSAYFTSINKLSVTFYPDTIEYPADYMMFCIYSRYKPADNSVLVTYTENSSAYIAQYEGGLYEEGRYNYYFYRVQMAEDCDYVNISLSTNGTYTGDYGIFSCFGVTSVIDTYAKADFIVNNRIEETEGVTSTAAKKYTAADLPFTYRNDTTDNLVASDISIRLDSDRFKTTSVEKVTFYFTTYNEHFYVSASLVAKDQSVQNVNNLKYNLAVDSAWGMVNQYEEGLGTSYQYGGYQLEVDLSGYDLSKYELVIGLSVDPVNYASTGSIDTKMVEFTLRSITYVPMLAVTPWYQPIKNALDKLRNEVVSVLDWIYEGISDVYSAIREKFGILQLFLEERWEDFSSMWTNRWDTLMAKLDEYFGNDGELANQGEAMQEQANQMQQANDAMNSVEKPNLDTGAMLDQYLNFNPAGLAILSVITNNPFATSMLVVIFTFALCGYIFFGKKR